MQQQSDAICELVPMARVADVERSIAFYELLGFSVKGRHHSPDGTTVWAGLESGRAMLYLSRATDAGERAAQRVLFYCYSHDLVSLRERLLADGRAVSAISHPFYMEKGECRLEDPDGYVLLIGQAD